MLNLIQDDEKKGDLNPIPTQRVGGGRSGRPAAGQGTQDGGSGHRGLNNCLVLYDGTAQGNNHNLPLTMKYRYKRITVTCKENVRRSGISW